MMKINDYHPQNLVFSPSIITLRLSWKIVINCLYLENLKNKCVPSFTSCYFSLINQCGPGYDLKLHPTLTFSGYLKCLSFFLLLVLFFSKFYPNQRLHHQMKTWDLQLHRKFKKTSTFVILCILIIFQWFQLYSKYRK